MKKFLTKIISCMAVIAIVFGCGFLFTGCDSNSASKVMNLTLNPSIELVLDGNNKVLSVNANNNEGNFIIANATFVGLTAEEAVDLFIEINYENGFMIKGQAGEGKNMLAVEISGADAEKLYDKIKTSAQEYLETIGADVELNFFEVSREDIEVLVETCMQEFSETAIEKMSEKELLKLIVKSREETKDMLSEELKTLYYEARAEEIIKAKFIAIIDELGKILDHADFDWSEMKKEFNDAMDLFSSALRDFKTNFKQNFLESQSEYQLAMQDFMKAKKDLLEARIDEIVDTTEIEKTLSEAEKELAKVGEGMMSIFEELNSQIAKTIGEIDELLEGLSAFINMGRINQIIEEKKQEISENFNAEFADFLGGACWEEMKPDQDVA